MQKFYSVNLHGGEDTAKAAEFYKQLFGWQEGTLSEGHSELWANDSLRIVFSRPTKNCPVSPGTITMEFYDLPDFSKSGLVREEGTGNSSSYLSYLDPWKNRIWVYVR
ncbi:hypothetical protein [Leptospira idonii]|uniref:VOC family protein n=1 Tax=Leptospira idonii TaxID=1193500 RepID=A0A4R9M0E9_9LEPT|nr:hypothetical protein [Leptospira idonii]TGN18699.1 hypothetical protein EHS15_15115 [Leptospira idonii]